MHLEGHCPFRAALDTLIKGGTGIKSNNLLQQKKPGHQAGKAHTPSEAKKSYSKTLVCEHNLFQKHACNPKHLYIKAFF